MNLFIFINLNLNKEKMDLLGSQPVDTRKIRPRPIRGVALHATIRGSGPVTVNSDNPGEGEDGERGLRPQQLESFRGRPRMGGGARGAED